MSQKKRIMLKARLDEISLVDRPAQVGAKIVMRKRDFSADERKKLADSGAAMSDGSFPIVTVEDLKNAIQAIGRAGDPAAAKAHIKTRARALGATDLLPDSFGKNDITPQGPAGPLNKGTTPADIQAADGGNQETPMTPEEKAAFEKAAEQKLQAMEKRAQRAEKIAEMTDGQKLLFVKLEDAQKDEFLALAPEKREEQVQKASDGNPIVYTALNGDVFRKSDDPRMVATAKRADESDKRALAAEKVSKQEKLAKRAGEMLKSLKGDEKAKVSLLEAVESLPADVRGPVEEMLKAADGAVALVGKTLGENGEPEASTGEQTLTAIAKRLQVEDPKLSSAAAMKKAMRTPEGRKAYSEHVGG